MRLSRITALLTALTASISLCSCSLPGSDSSESSTESTTASSSSSGKKTGTLPDAEVSLDDVRDHVKGMLEDLKVSGNSAVIKDDIDTLMYDMNACSDASNRRQIAYYLDFDNTELEAAYDESYRTLYIAYQLVTYAIAHCNEKDEYKELVAPHITDEEAIEAYADPSMTLKRIEGYAGVDFDLLDERTDEYYAIYQDDTLDDDEKALKCAELYLDLLTQYSTEDFYDNYNRDYTPELAIELCDEAYDKLYPAMFDIRDAFVNCDGAYDIINDPMEFSDPFGTIQKYAPKLSDDIKNAADRIIEKKLFYIADDEKAFPGSFTTELPLTNDSAIFLNSELSLDNMLAAIHEFGHYYASYYDPTNAYDQTVNLDVAEIQSQGFEFIFMRFYDDIFGDQAEAMKLYKTYSMLDSIISGFLVGKFEYTVLSQRDELDPQGVVNIWNEIMDEYTDMEFYEINHLFEMPGYYVSYAVSALAAFDIWNDCLDSPDAALAKYEKITKVPANSADTKFLETLKSCGFSDVMTKEYINRLTDELSEYADEYK